MIYVIIGVVIGVCLGVFGSWLGNRELRQKLKLVKEINHELENLKIQIEKEKDN